MALFRIRPTRSRRLSRGMAFAAQGVALKYPSHSWSGVRGTDGGVVLAILAADVQVDECGCRCLLWSPMNGEPERASHQERLEHCSLAVRRGTAEALLAYGEDALFDADEAIALVVVRVGSLYWGRWGTVARAGHPDRLMQPGMPRAEACLAA